jgi:biopolymer transport protein ExbB
MLKRLLVHALSIAILVCLAGGAMTPVLAQDDSPSAEIEASGDTADSPTDTPPSDSATPSDKAGSVGIKEIIEWGGMIGKFIILLSVITLTLVAFNATMIRRGVLMPQQTVDELSSVLLEDLKLKDALAIAEADKSLLGRIIATGLVRARGGFDEMEQVMDDVAEDEAMRLEQVVGYFSLIAAIAPLCGLLGTVWGMILAFNKIQYANVVTPAVLAEHIQTALVTTCFGLVVAIPNVIAYSMFRNKLHRLLAEVSLVVEDLTTPFRGLKPTPGARRPASAQAKTAKAAAAPTSEQGESTEKPTDTTQAASEPPDDAPEEAEPEANTDPADPDSWWN